MSQSGHLPGPSGRLSLRPFALSTGKAATPAERRAQLRALSIPISRACGLVWNCSDTILECLRSARSAVYTRLRTYAASPGGADCDQEEAGFNDG